MPVAIIITYELVQQALLALGAIVVAGAVINHFFDIRIRQRTVNERMKRGITFY